MDLNGFTCLIFSSFSGPMWTIASSTYVYYTTIIVKGAVHKWRRHFFIYSSCYHFKVEIFLEQRKVAFLSPRKIYENLNFSTEIQIFANFAGW